ncbi:hypothetical protein SHAQ108633_11525 [Shewanella aquimarina]
MKIDKNDLTNDTPKYITLISENAAYVNHHHLIQIAAKFFNHLKFISIMTQHNKGKVSYPRQSGTHLF